MQYYNYLHLLSIILILTLKILQSILFGNYVTFQKTTQTQKVRVKSFVF